MKPRAPRSFLFCLLHIPLVMSLWLTAGLASAQVPLRTVPEALRGWEDWATWDVPHRDCPTPYNDGQQHICFWPSRLTLNAEPTRASWSLSVFAYERTWVPLPGNNEVWPTAVLDNKEAIPVVEHDGWPSVQLTPGKHDLTGSFQWATMPERLAIPKEIGVLSLTIGGSAVAIPNWDTEGVWLQRLKSESQDQDNLTVQVYRVIEDGIPLWLRTEIELSVSGKSREEDFGFVLPQGWKLSLVDSPIPVAIDEAGRMKIQVRAGKWTVALHAFNTNDVREIGYAAGTTPLVDQELIGFRANPEFRSAEIDGIPPMDVTQTTFPAKWRDLPVYQWTTATPFRINEKMRGMGSQRPPGLTIERQFWLDENGKGITYSDRITGQMQQIWRLNATPGQKLGAVRVDGKGQLITTDPTNQAEGFEVRSRNLQLQAIGRIEQTRSVPATGWQADADSLQISLNLPPGWRVLALFGADNVYGDWLTAWSLLDLFLLLIFSLAVFRLWGFVAGVIAFLAFGLAYHEPGSLRYTWFFLLIPVALLRVVPEGGIRRLVTTWKYVAVALLALLLIPFVALQIQSVIYPQLEPAGFSYGMRAYRWWGGGYRPYAAPSAPTVEMNGQWMNDMVTSNSPASGSMAEENLKAMQQQGELQAKFRTSNMAYEAKAKIQTGPAQPDWEWNTVRCVWNGPVASTETIRPILISLPLHRVLTLVRIALLLLLTGILLYEQELRRWIPWRRVGSAAATVASLLLILGLPSPALAEVPNPQVLDQLRERLMKPSDAYPNAAMIDSVKLRVAGNRITMDAAIHAVIPVAVPLPGKLPAWSPVSIQVEGQPDAVVVRRDGYLWIWLPAGVHQVKVEGLIPEATEWDWSFTLTPRHVTIDAPDWNVSGVNASGVPERQVFFTRKLQVSEGEATYDRKDFQAIVAIDRSLEIGLVWQVTSTVSRLSNSGKAVALRVPLLPGERVLSSNATVRDGFIEVRLGANEDGFQWQSELPTGQPIQLQTKADDTWVERWHLVTSPVWNVVTTGIAPIYQANEQNLIPFWQPWPGESASLSFTKPIEVPGETVTVQNVKHTTSLGDRQRTHQLELAVESSLGSDFAVDLDTDIDITSLEVDGQTIPPRLDGNKVMIPLKPGRQQIGLKWRSEEKMETTATIGRVTLPIPSANVWSTIEVPDSRWVLWANGPLRGPAVRFWVILACAIVAAMVLGAVKGTPLNRLHWMLLTIGLTQVHLLAALIVVGWFFVLSLRGKEQFRQTRIWRFNLFQVLIVLHTIATLSILIAAVGEGLLGNPRMFIVGNGSTRNTLQWFQPRTELDLPQPQVITVSVWFYRLLMLLWALWLANALIRWLKWGWEQFSQGGIWIRRPEPARPAVVRAEVVKPS